MPTYDSLDKHQFRSNLLPFENESLQIGRPGLRYSAIYAKQATVDTLNYVTLNPPPAGASFPQLANPDGTAGAPAYSWASETNSGWYRVGAGDIALSILGTKTLDVQATATTVAQGNLIIPANTNQIVLGTANTGTITMAALGASQTYTLPAVGGTLIVLPGSASITTVGTIGTGTWQGTVISPTFGGTGLSNPTAHGILVGEGSSNVSPITLTNGQLLIGSTGADPVAATLTAGTGIASITNAAGSITINATATSNPVYTDQLTGLNLSFNSTTVFNIAAGAAASSEATVSSRVLMTLASAFTKSTSTWAVGTGNGGNASGVAIAANTWYHVFLIRRTDTGVVDVAFDTSATGANIAANTNANYTNVRRIGSLLTDASSHWLSWFQNGDEFLWTVPNALDVNTTNPGTSAVTVTSGFLPLGVRTIARLNLGLDNTATANLDVLISAMDVTDTAPSTTLTPLASFSSGPNAGLYATTVSVVTNTSAQYRYRLTASGASVVFRAVVTGWSDPRGKGV